MIKICRDKWDKNKNKLLDALKSRTDLNDCGYKALVELTYSTVFNDEDNGYGDDLDTRKITEINDGDYQGTLIYVIPFNTYQPSECEYLMTYVNYGSCSGCDTLLAIQSYGENKLTDSQIKDFMSLCKDIFLNTIKPFNGGWRNEEKYSEVTI